MLKYLHVKNFALIDEVEIEFTKGFNVLTGETGAGKSILIGSVNLALGNKAGQGIIGRYGESAFVEIGFFVNDAKAARLEALDVYPEDNMVYISKRVFENRSVLKVNGETMTLAAVRKITEILIDIHGQHDHQSLFNKAKHLDILDRYAKDSLEDIKIKVCSKYEEYRNLQKELAEFTISEEERLKNISFLKYEIDEIENASIKDGEDEELENLYRKITNSKKITEELAFVINNTNSSDNNASDLISRSLVSLNHISSYDGKITDLCTQLSDIENLLNDFNNELSSYMGELEFDEDIFYQTEKRLDLINLLKSKYGNSIEKINNYLEDAKQKLDFYSDYEEKLEQTKIKTEETKNELLSLCGELSLIRKKFAKQLESDITDTLLNLNFPQVRFEINFNECTPCANGFDDVEFVISMNPGEALKPLKEVASGGELSRIMLGIKSVLAGKDDIDSLIFDEIDTGISGRTAQKVAEKIALISSKHQVICITHLPQIAAMADTHFLIEKSVENDSTRTTVTLLDNAGEIKELSRILGGSEITDSVEKMAIEMKQQASKLKNMSE